MDTLEIYIPEDARVGSIPLCTIPQVVLDAMRLPRPSPNRSPCSQSPEATWISPVLVQSRSYCATSDTDVLEPCGTLWSLRKTLAGAGAGASAATHSSPRGISFVTSNRLAFEALRVVRPGTQLTATTTRGRNHCSGFDQDGVVIYKGRIYLSVKRPRRRRGDPARTPTQPAAQALSPASLGSDRHFQASQEPLPTDSPPSYPGELHVPEDSVGLHEDRDEEQEHDVISISSSSDVENTTSSCLPMWEATSSGQPRDEDPIICSALDPPQERRLSTTYADFDFEELAQEEMIARIRAKLSESEAALKSLSF